MWMDGREEREVWVSEGEMECRGGREGLND